MRTNRFTCRPAGTGDRRDRLHWRARGARVDRRGAEVHATSRRSAADVHGAQVHTCDLANADAVDRVISAVKPDFVFHLASHVYGSRDITHVLPSFEANLTSTIYLLHATATHAPSCKRFVLAGSLEEPDRGGVPSSPYAASKLAASQYAKMFYQLYASPVTIARIFMAYGPAQRDEKKLVPYVTRSLLKGESPRLTSGTRPVDWVYVQDVADSLIACATTPGLEGQTVDIGTGQLTTVRSVVERISNLVGQGTPVFGSVEDRTDEQVRAADPTVASRLLGRPMVDVEEGLRRTVEWYRTQPS
ncbi:MAG: NAD-dependent epimerase/dehydratase family protein [Tepidisphaeraceae bacterium]